MELKQDVVYKVESGEYLHGFMRNKTVVYSDIPDEYDAYINALWQLDSEEPTATGKEVVLVEYDIPKPVPASLQFTANPQYIVLDEDNASQRVYFEAIAKDKFGMSVEDVDYPKWTTISETGEHVFEATAGDLTQSVTVVAVEKDSTAEVTPESDTEALSKRIELLEETLLYVLENKDNLKEVK